MRAPDSAGSSEGFGASSQDDWFEFKMSTSLAAFAVLAGVTLLALLSPLLAKGRRTAMSRDQLSEEVVKEKIRQIRKDKEAGLLREAEASGAEAELGRMLLGSARRRDGRETHEVTASGRSSLALAAVAAVTLGTGVYLSLGDWRNVLDGEIAAAPGASGPHLLSEHEGAQMSDAIASLRDRLARNPADADNWHLLARSYSAVGAYDGAVEAYEKVIELRPLDMDIRGDYAEDMIRAQEGFVGPAAVREFEIIATHAPNDPRALYYLALRDAQAGESLSAAQGWAAILKTAPPDAPYRPAIEQILDAIIIDAGLDRGALDLPAASATVRAAQPARSAPGPTQADIAAASEMSATDQAGMIKTMVARLESRLEEDPTDIEGWLRLARSKAVLGDSAGAVTALEKGLAANPDDPMLIGALSDLGG